MLLDFSATPRFRPATRSNRDQIAELLNEHPDACVPILECLKECAKNPGRKAELLEETRRKLEGKA